MKLTLEREILAKKLQSSIGAIGSSMIPILNEVLFQVKNNRLFITSSNGEVQLTVSMNCEFKGEEQSFVCDARLFLTPVTTLKAKEVFLEVSEELVTLSTKRSSKYEAPIIYESENYPVLNAKEWSDPLEIKGDTFSKMVKKSSMFVDKNNIRMAMRGLLMGATGKTLTMQSIASSGNIICHLEALAPENTKFSEMKNVLLPKDTSNVAQEFEKSASISISTDTEGKCIKIHDNMSTVILRLLEGKFPNCKPFIDSYAPEVNVKMLTEDISLALKRAGGFSDEHGLTKIDMESENIKIECDNTQFKRRATEEVTALYKSSEMSFTFGMNFKYLTKTLLTMSGENTFISMLGPKQQCYLSDDASEGFNTLWIIAPMMLAKTVEK